MQNSAFCTLQIGEDAVVRVPYSLWEGAKGVATSRTPVVYRKTNISMERSLVGRKMCGLDYPGSRTWHKSDGYFTEQNKQWTNKICTDLTPVKFTWSGINLCKLPFGKPDWRYQSENRGGARWEKNIKMNRIWIVSKGVDSIYKTQNKEYLQAFVYTVMIFRLHRIGGISSLVLRVWIYDQVNFMTIVNLRHM